MIVFGFNLTQNIQIKTEKCKTVEYSIRNNNYRPVFCPHIRLCHFSKITQYTLYNS